MSEKTIVFPEMFLFLNEGENKKWSQFNEARFPAISHILKGLVGSEAIVPSLEDSISLDQLTSTILGNIFEL